MSCQHKGCRCQDIHVERGGRKFCSEACAELEATATPGANCTCGHVECAAV